MSRQYNIHNILSDFDPQREIEHIVMRTREHFAETAGKGTIAVIGMSGGKDSTITGALLARALGPEHVLGVLMPDGEQSDIEDAIEAVKAIGIPARTVNIYDINTYLYASLRKATDPITGEPAPIKPNDNVFINTPPRSRMSVLYAVAASLENGGRVINTCNRSEDYIGYSTKNGDAAGDFSLLCDYTVTEILAIGRCLTELPERLVVKTPSDGLCGKSDEDRFGFSYYMLDRYLLTGMCDDISILRKIQAMHKANMHKLLPMPHVTKRAA